MRTNTTILPFLFFGSILTAQTPRLVVPIGHTKFVKAVAFSPVERLVLTGGQDRKVILWGYDGREIRTYENHSDLVSAVAFSPDGQYILSGSQDKTAFRCKLDGSDTLRLSSGHTGAITSVAFDPNGKFILTGSEDSTAGLWDAGGKFIRAITGHTDVVTSVAFSPNGKLILTASRDSTARLWDLNGKPGKVFEEHGDWVLSAVFSPDGKLVLTGSMDRTARLRELSGGNPRSFTDHTDRVSSVAFSPDGTQVLTGSDDLSARLWNLAGEPVDTFSGHTSYITSVAFSPKTPEDPAGGKYVLTGSEDNSAVIWTSDGAKQAILTGHSSTVNSVAWSPAGQYLLSGNSDSTARLWDLTHPRVTVLSGHSGEITSAKFSPGGDSILTGSKDHTARLWHLNGDSIQIFSGHTEWVNSAAFSPDGQQILTGSKDRTARTWTLDGKHKPFTQYQDEVTAVDFASTGNPYVVARGNSLDLFWEGQSSFVRANIRGITSAVFSPDGDQLLVGSQDHTAKLLGLAGQVEMTFPGHQNWVSSVAFSPPTDQDPDGGEYLLSGSWDNTVKLWNYTGEPMHTFRGHSARVNSVAFSANAKFVLSGSGDNTAKIWNRSTGEMLLTLIALDDGEWAVTAPTGMFDASPGAMSLMYFVVGQEIIELDQLKERYYEPGLLAKTLGFSTDWLRSVDRLDSVELFPAVSLSLDSTQHRLRIALSPRSGGVGKLSIFVNGKEIIEDAVAGKAAGITRDTTITIALDTFSRYFLSSEPNAVAVRVYNRENWLRSPMHTVEYSPSFVSSKGGPSGSSELSSLDDKPDPALHLLLVGVADYAGTTLDLRYTAKDAEDMAAALRQAGGQLFGADSVFVHLLSTTPDSLQPSKANIKAAFEAIARRAKAEDILVAYFSGHGTNYGDAEKSLFYFLTMEIGDFNLSDPWVRDQRAISSDELTRWINQVPAQKQVLIVDACNSGKVAEDIMRTGGKSLTSSQIRALERVKDRTGMFILSGSAADQKSFEASGFRQSLLTYSLLEGMKSGAALDAGNVDVIRLFQHAELRVPVLARNLQEVQVPMPAFPKGGGTIYLGTVNDRVTIPLDSINNIFIRSTFQDEAHFDDPLGLSSATDSYLIEQDAAGASYIFLDVRDFAGAYSIKGLYNTVGSELKLRARLFKGKEPVGDLITDQGPRNDLNAMTRRVGRKATQTANEVTRMANEAARMAKEAAQMAN